ncbi:MAG: histidine phosphatase family protein [Phycisphaerae bacterium]|nr:histidine phosphatase family protein [Tepidisphaeraceae bacterium]
MRPQRIILIRHGESQANVDRSLHGHTPDHKIALTPRGHEQAASAGRKLWEELVRPDSDSPFSGCRQLVQFYTSPYLRTRQTFQGILAGMRECHPELDQLYRNYEDPRLREQEFGNYRPPGAYDSIRDERDQFGTFFYRIEGGESGADVYDRLTGAMDTMHRDFAKADFPANMIVVSHGLTIRLFLMRWFHWTVEEFEKLRNPKNCQYYVLEKMPGEKYELKTEMLKYTEAETHAYLAKQGEGTTVDLTAERAGE